MIGNTELTEELVRLLDEHPREARDNRFSSTLCGEMAVMRLLHNSRQKMTAGELSSRLDMTTSRKAALHEQNIADALHAWRGCADVCSSPRARV